VGDEPEYDQASLTAAKNAALLGIEIKADGGGADRVRLAIHRLGAARVDHRRERLVHHHRHRQDGSGNPMSGVAVTLSATGSGNSITQPVGTTNGSGVATAA
jgi:hypothetical protein